MKIDRLMFGCAILSLVLLSGCNTMQSEVVLEPVRMGTKTVQRADRVGACFDLDRSVIAPSRLTLADTEIGAGYENTFLRGADPAPCNLRRNFAHQGALLFDFSELARRHAVVIEATLEATPRVVLFPEGVVINMQLYLAKEDWAAGNFTDPLNTVDSRGQIPLSALPTGDETYALAGAMHDSITAAGVAARVTHTVLNWTQHASQFPNHGFVISPVPEHLFAEENQNLLVVYTNVRLRLKILEPRSP